MNEEQNLPAQQSGITPKEIPQAQPVKKEPADENMSPGEPIAEVEHPLTLNPQPLTSAEMEVHHHPDLHHKPKKWKEYFLEFLMIFMAVTMGFIAENIREHITEHKNAKILAQSLLEDIKKDTASLHTITTFSYLKLRTADSLIAIIHRPRNLWNDTNIYRNIGPAMTSIPFISTDGTYAQMKTSGSLRYFHQALVNQLNAYAVQLKKTEYRDIVDDKVYGSLVRLILTS